MYMNVILFAKILSGMGIVTKKVVICIVLPRGKIVQKVQSITVSAIQRQERRQKSVLLKNSVEKVRNLKRLDREDIS